MMTSSGRKRAAPQAVRDEALMDLGIELRKLDLEAKKSRILQGKLELEQIKNMLCSSRIQTLKQFCAAMSKFDSQWTTKDASLVLQTTEYLKKIMFGTDRVPASLRRHTRSQ